MQARSPPGDSSSFRSLPLPPAPRDGYLLEYIVKEGAGLSLPDEPFKVNVVFKYLFYIMGVWPLVYTALLFPAGRSGNGAPAWPFVTLSYAFGERAAGWGVLGMCGGDRGGGLSVCVLGTRVAGGRGIW